MSTKKLRSLYPEINPYKIGFLKVSELHELYYEESGNPKGKPVLFLHGGPGGGTKKDHRRFFDPIHYRIILFDQRGCGKSKPHASLKENTTEHLILDIEKLRSFLNVDCWQIFGGSWGSTLALAYSEVYPAQVTELVLRGIFTLRKKELDWFYKKGASVIFPDKFLEFIEIIPENERHDLIKAYYKRLTSSNIQIQTKAAKAWCRWEASTGFLVPRFEHISNFENEKHCLSFARIECHYFINKGFFENENLIFERLDRIRNIPAVIVQGRYDVICPMETAWELHNTWPEADFKILLEAGHSAFEKEIINELVLATDSFR